MTKEYREGWSYHKSNGDILDNPYPKDSNEWWEWFYGWRDSMEDTINRMNQ